MGDFRLLRPSCSWRRSSPSRPMVSTDRLRLVMSGGGRARWVPKRQFDDEPDRQEDLMWLRLKSPGRLLPSTGLFRCRPVVVPVQSSPTRTRPDSRSDRQTNMRPGGCEPEDCRQLTAQSFVWPERALRQQRRLS
jgi:hypothetical protein